MAPASEAKHAHPGGDPGLYAVHAILDYQAIVRFHSHPASREKEQIRSGLASGDLGRAENMRVEVTQQSNHRETSPHPLRPAA